MTNYKCRNCGKEITKGKEEWSFWGGTCCSLFCLSETDYKMKHSIDSHADPLGFYQEKAKMNDLFD